MKPDEIIINPEHTGRFSIGKTVVLTPEEAGLTAPLADLALLKRATRKLERLRLNGVFTPTKSGPNRKQRRASRG